MIPISDLVKVKQILYKTIYRKDQKRVVYVTADMAGAMESVCHFGMTEKLDKIDIPKGYELNELYMDQPT
jgi:multidrug efflux pump subunit AcrB